MVELMVLTGPQTGVRLVVPSLPASVGRGREMGVQLTGSGVWDRHFDLLATPDGRVGVRVIGDARVVIDSVSVTERSLRNGEVLEVGGIQVRFLIDEVPQRSLAVREASVWLLALLILVLQIYLAWWTGR